MDPRQDSPSRLIAAATRGATVPPAPDASKVPGLLRRLWDDYLRQHWGKMALACFLMTLEGSTLALISWMLKPLFDLVFIIWGQYVSATAGTSTMATYMYLNGHMAGSYGYGNAVAVVLFIISLAIALGYQRFVLRRDTEGALTGMAGSSTKEPRP